jgi:hypothetical protein
MNGKIYAVKEISRWSSLISIDVSMLYRGRYNTRNRL